MFSHLDGLNDYDEDFNIIDKVIDAVKDSNYRVGKGLNGNKNKRKADKDEEEVLKETDLSDVQKPSDPDYTEASDNGATPHSSSFAVNSSNPQEDPERPINSGRLKKGSDRKETSKRTQVARKISLRNVRKPKIK